MLDLNGRGERIRTSDLTVPNRALYQAEPRPELLWDSNTTEAANGKEQGAKRKGRRQSDGENKAM